MKEPLRGKPWERCLLKDLVTLRSGGTPSMARDDYWDSGDIPWLTAKDLKSFELCDSQLKITCEGAKAGSRIAPAGSILILIRGMTLFKDVPLGIATRPLAFGQDLKALEPNEKVLGKFLAWKLRAAKHHLMQMVDSAGHGTGRLSTDLLASLPIHLPDLKEQAAIVEVLDGAEAATRSVETLLKRKADYKKALAEDLLSGRRRSASFTEPWHKIKLSKFFVSKDDRAPTKTPLILSCSKVYGILPQSERFSKQLASVSNGHYKHVVPGDLIYDPMLLWDASIAFSEYEGIVSPAYETLKWIGDEAGERRFFKTLFKSHTMRYVYTTISQGTNARRRKAPVTDFLKVCLELPDAAEQRLIADVLSALDDEIDLLRKQRQALNEQKKGLMQKLLTGEVRLKGFQR